MAAPPIEDAFVEVQAVRVALVYDRIVPPDIQSKFRYGMPLGADGRVRFITEYEEAEASFRTLAGKVENECKPKVYLFSVPSYKADVDTFDFEYYETYIGALADSSVDLECIRTLATTLQSQDGLTFRMIDTEEVNRFLLPKLMWDKVIITRPPVPSNGLRRWLVHPKYGGLRDVGSKRQLETYKLKGERIQYWINDAPIKLDPKWVEKKTGSYVFTFGSRKSGEKTADFAASRAVCIDIANGANNAAVDDDSVTAFGNLRFSTITGIQKTSDVLAAVVAPAATAQAKRSSSKRGLKRKKDSNSNVFDVDFMTRIVYKLTNDRLNHYDDKKGLRDSKRYPVVLALPRQYLSIANDISRRVFEVAILRLKAGRPTYILVPVLNKTSSWTVAGLFISPAQALRLHGNPIWTLDDDKSSDVVETLHKTLTDMLVVDDVPGGIPILQLEVADISCSMYFVPKGGQSDTGTSVVAMLMSQIGLRTSDGSGYSNLPLACDYCQKKSALLTNNLDAFAANARDPKPPRDGDDHDGGKDLDGGGGDDDGGKRSPVLKKRAAESDTQKPHAVRAAEPDAGGGGIIRNIGLQNTGVTCYMNAVLIGLFKILPIQDFLRRLNNAVTLEPGHAAIQTAIAKFDSSKQLVKKPKENDGLSPEAKNVVVACMWFRACDAVFRQYHLDAITPPVATIQLVNGFRTLDWYYSTLMEGQQDASEFLNACLDKLLFFSLQWSNENQVPGVNSRLSNAYTTEVQTTINVPEGHAVSSAEPCVNTGERNTVVRYGKLDVPLHLDDGIYDPISDQIQQLLFNSEDVDYRCDTCIPDPKERERSDAFTCKKTTRATFVPEYVIASLNRFQTNPITHRREKIVGTVKPDADGNVHIIKDGRPIAYEILCALKHEGNLAGGHYYAITKEGIDKYVKFDDSRVADMSEDGANKILETAYVYILKRNDGALFGGAGGFANGVGAGAAVGADGGRGRQRLSRLHRYASLD